MESSMKKLLLAATLAALPTGAFATWNGTDKLQCAYTYVSAQGNKMWVYGTTTVFRPEAKPDAKGKCDAKSSNCEFYGCFHRK
jgi:hypothetical protein